VAERYEFGLISPSGEYHSRHRNFAHDYGPEDFHDTIARDIDAGHPVSKLLRDHGWVRYHNDGGMPFVELEGVHKRAVKNAVQHIQTHVKDGEQMGLALTAWSQQDPRPDWAMTHSPVSKEKALQHLRHVLTSVHGAGMYESAEDPPGNPEYHRKYEFGLISPTGEYHARERNFNSGYDPKAYHHSIADDHTGRSVSSLLKDSGWVRYHNDMGRPFVQCDVAHPHAIRNAIKHIEKIEPHKSVNVSVSNWNKTKPELHGAILGVGIVGKEFTSPEQSIAYLKGVLKKVHGVDESYSREDIRQGYEHGPEWEYGMIAPWGKRFSGKRRSDWAVGPSKFHNALVKHTGEHADDLVKDDGWVRYHSDLGRPYVQLNSDHPEALVHTIDHVERGLADHDTVTLDDDGCSLSYKPQRNRLEAARDLRAVLANKHGSDVRLRGLDVMTAPPEHLKQHLGIRESLDEALGTCKHCGSFFQRSVLRDHVGTCSERGSVPEPAPRRARAPREHPLIKKAKKHFGVTHDPREAGYITPDGQMLDLSGKNDGGDPGHRARDHREISHITPDKLPDDLESDSPTHHMWHFMRETGAVRMSYSPDPRNRFAPASVNVDFMRKPTMAQRQTLARIGRGSELVYDVFHPKTLERLHSDDTGRSSIGSMLSMVDHHLKEDTPRADQLIRQKLEEGRKRQYFFHGTKARLRRGDLVMPASKVEGGKTNYDATDKDYAYAMTRADHALDYAEVSHQEGKPVVYRVRSLGDHEPDPSDDSRGEYVRSRTGFRVMGKVRKP
jgi:hypothetical protein